MKRPRSFVLLSFLCGFCVGVFISFSCVFTYRRSTASATGGIAWPMRLGWTERDLKAIEPIEGMWRSVPANDNQITFNDSHFHGDDTTVADGLYQKVRILCLVMTYPENHRKKAIHVNATWGKRCNKLLFLTRTADEKLPTLILNVTDGRSRLGQKTRDAFDHAYQHHLADYDWFLKADDDTYVIMENLRYFLSAQDHNSPVFFGHAFSQYVQQGFASGGAGYVASREALSRYGRRSKLAGTCKFSFEAEDLDFGECMESLGVRLGYSLDALGRTRFHCLPPEAHLSGKYPDWYYKYDKQNGTKKGLGALSDYAISFHYVKPGDMYLMEYLVYHLNPYGIIKGLQNLNTNDTTVRSRSALREVMPG